MMNDALFKMKGLKTLVLNLNSNRKVLKPRNETWVEEHRDKVYNIIKQQYERRRSRIWI